MACLGDSITAGARVDAKTQSYPARLQELLGDDYEVRNFGIGGATLIKTGRPNVWRDLEAVQKFQPHIAIISLGTNDTVGGRRKNWEQIERFDDDFTEFIGALGGLADEAAHRGLYSDRDGPYDARTIRRTSCRSNGAKESLARVVRTGS